MIRKMPLLRIQALLEFFDEEDSPPKQDYYADGIFVDDYDYYVVAYDYDYYADGIFVRYLVV